MLVSWEQDLLEAATELAETLPENDEHTVAAAAMDAEGRIFTGVNVYHFNGGPCAELVVLGAAAAAGSAALISIVAVGNGGRGILPPCGRCRQSLLDYFPDISVLMPRWPGQAGPTPVRVRELLPGNHERPGQTIRPRTLFFAARYYGAVLDGSKTITNRYHDPMAVGPVTLVFEFDQAPKSLPGRVLSVRPVQLSELMAEQDELDGPGAGEQFLHGLRQHYPGLEPHAELEQVAFRVEQ
ncbi:ASCH domain-containing protein [Psychromicrobium lacuslunae]|uniref:CMP/dCMP-type deaminase domain-containing protein n=1 Tax=Psychromicrobium lacuslunae TaxID=1618207 RepID=A0A0D4BZX5_9MICC|nr:ASCH domain-containing protein [Psychromicrobium lacuslunae]AJT41869.1 hypothetical protein UM93_10730 [Psychromicrobium lacuslunae]